MVTDIPQCLCRWVPFLFGVAGVILGLGHSTLDAVQAARKVGQSTAKTLLCKAHANPILNPRVPLQPSGPLHSTNPSWAVVSVGIAAFVLQYAASGALEEPLLHGQIAGLPALDVLLSSIAILHWYMFDRTSQGTCFCAMI